VLEELPSIGWEERSSFLCSRVSIVVEAQEAKDSRWQLNSEWRHGDTSIYYEICLKRIKTTLDEYYNKNIHF
jgi:hypothetical protein